MLDAAEGLLADRSFEELTIADVVRHGKSSVGAFYTRFSNKDALLDALYERHQRQAIATMEQHLAPERWESASVEQIIEQIVGFTVRFHRAHRGLLRALVLRGYMKPDWRYETPKMRNKLGIASVGALLATRRGEIAHPNAKLAGSLGLLFVLAVLREKMLFGDSTASALRISDRRLEEELVRAYLAYLGVPQRKPQRKLQKRQSPSQSATNSKMRRRNVSK